ncbi:ty3-gypsy retrotransposon protein [Tanacetum coccineum]
MWNTRPHYIEDKESKEYASHGMRDLTELAIYPNEGFTLTQFINSLLDGFKWGTVEAAAFDALKHQLSHAPILGLPNFDDTFVVEADTSSKGIGVVFATTRVAAKFFSLKLFRTKYSTQQQEVNCQPLPTATAVGKK